MCREHTCLLYSESRYTYRYHSVHTRYEAEDSPPRFAVPAPWTARLLNASRSVTASLRRHSGCAPIAISDHGPSRLIPLSPRATYRLSNSLEPVVYVEENAATAAPHMTCKLIETWEGSQSSVAGGKK
jgi:hypothetical protein